MPSVSVASAHTIIHVSALGAASAGASATSASAIASLEILNSLFGVADSKGGSRRRIVMVNKGGIPLEDGWLNAANMGDVSWDELGNETWSFEMTTSDEKFNSVIPEGQEEDLGHGEPYREAILWRGDTVLSWGPTHTPKIDNGKLSVSGAGLKWYYQHRFVGFAKPYNYIPINANFEDGMDYWTEIYSENESFNLGNLYPNAYAEVVRHPLFWDRKALHLHDNTGNPPDDDPNWHQILVWRFVRFTAKGDPFDLTFSADCYVDNITSPNPAKSGLVICALPDTYSGIGFADIMSYFAHAQSTIDETYPAGPQAEVQRHSASITIPAATDCWVMIQFSGCNGDTYWSDPWLEEHTGLIFNEDQGNIAFKMSDHITGQTNSPFINAWRNPDWPWYTQDYGKSTLNIDAFVDITNTFRKKAYYFGDGTTGSSILDELAGYDDGYETWFKYAPTAPTRKRELKGARKKGYFRRDLPLRYGPGNRGNILTYSWEFNGDQGANAVTARKSSNGPAAGASDLSSFANNLTIEEYVSVPDEVAVNQLAQRAQYHLDQKQRPVTVTCKIPASPYFDRGLRVGDRVPVAIHDGNFHLVEQWMWIRKMTLTADDFLELTLNRWPGYSV